jgi:hypothetical protein
MSFASELEHLVEGGVAGGLTTFASHLDARWVDAAIARHTPATLRRRKLPAESVVWLVVGMALFRDHSIADVVRRLDLVVPEAEGGKGAVVDGALPKARYRVGEAPLHDLFATSASHWSHASAAQDQWRGLSVYAMDGTTLSVPDTEENREAFHLPATGRGQSGYPKVRVVTLMAARSHLLVDAVIGPFHGKGTAEPSLARPMWDGVPDHALLIADRNFIDYAQLHRFRHTGTDRHWLVHMKKNLAYQPVRDLGDGDQLVEVVIGDHHRREDAQLPRQMPVRIISYELDGGPQRLMTSLLDAERWPADEVIEMYHERWEIEIAFDELKTHMLERTESLRSKAPVGVRQEIWGLLLAYNLIRHRMAIAARKLDIEPRGMSFVYSLRLIRAFLIATAWDGSPANLPRHLETLDRELESATLPARRRERRYERWVKVKMSGYKRNPGRPATILESKAEKPK